MEIVAGLKSVHLVFRVFVSYVVSLLLLQTFGISLLVDIKITLKYFDIDKLFN